MTERTEAIARAKAVAYVYDLDDADITRDVARVNTADLRTLIDAASQTEAWKAVAMGERERCAAEFVDRIHEILRDEGSYDSTTNVTELPERAEQNVEALEAAIAIIRAIPAPTLPGEPA